MVDTATSDRVGLGLTPDVLEEHLSWVMRLSCTAYGHCCLSVVTSIACRDKVTRSTEGTEAVEASRGRGGYDDHEARLCAASGGQSETESRRTSQWKFILLPVRVLTGGATARVIADEKLNGQMYE